VRAAGYTEVPILIVSANVFENQAERLRAAGCQAFIGKPVIESELMAVLERNLGLQWLAQQVTPPLPLSAAPAAAPPMRLPGDVRAELIRLVQLGHVRGLQQALDRIAATHPRLAATCSHLRGMVSRFELDRLRQALAEEDADTLDA